MPGLETAQSIKSCAYQKEHMVIIFTSTRKVAKEEVRAREQRKLAQRISSHVPACHAKNYSAAFIDPNREEGPSSSIGRDEYLQRPLVVVHLVRLVQVLQAHSSQVHLVHQTQEEAHQAQSSLGMEGMAVGRSVRPSYRLVGTEVHLAQHRLVGMEASNREVLKEVKVLVVRGCVRLHYGGEILTWREGRSHTRRRHTHSRRWHPHTWRRHS